jgi:purine nucleoside phosphorylase
MPNSNSNPIALAIIGGSGLYNMAGLTDDFQRMGKRKSG